MIAGLVKDYVTLPVQRAGDQFGDLAVRHDTGISKTSSGKGARTM